MNVLEDKKFTYPTASSMYDKAISFLNKELVGDESIKRYQDFIRLLPSQFTMPHVNSQILEFPLNGTDNWVDVNFSYNALTTPLHESSFLPESWKLSKEWKLLIRFHQACMEENLLSEIQGVDKMMWLEFDIGSSQCPKPNLWLKTRNANKLSFPHIIHRCANFFEIPEASLRLLQKCIDALEEGMHIMNLGFMLARTGNVYKLHIYGKNNFSNLDKYFKNIGLTGYDPSMFDVLKNLKNDVQDVYLSFDIINDQFGSKIGLELYKSGLDDQKAREQYFKAISSQCSIDIDKIQKFYQWHGYDSEFIGNSAIAPHFYLLQTRHFGWIKLVFAPKKTTLAKAYGEVEWELRTMLE